MNHKIDPTTTTPILPYCYIISRGESRKRVKKLLKKECDGQNDESDESTDFPILRRDVKNNRHKSQRLAWGGFG
jgi:hypothetical protein